VERVLADIDADHSDRFGCLRHGVLLVFGAPCQLRLLAGQEHDRTIPLPDTRSGRGYLARSDLGRHLSSLKSASPLAKGLTAAGVGIASTAIIGL